MIYSRYTNEQIIRAYQNTGSVWAAGRKLGLAGQTVHGRLRAIGHKTGGGWSEAEIERLRELVGQATIGQIADEFGRSYASIACKINELGAGSRYGNRIKRKVPRGLGLDKVSLKRHLKAIEEADIPVSRYCRQHGMNIDTFVRAIENNYPEWWVHYRNTHTDMPEAICPGCDEMFYPSNVRQVYCTRRCGSRHKADREYFGGKRKSTIGLAEGICQICKRKPKRGLSSHHIFGKQNDPDNDWLVALCSGCHQLVTLLGSRNLDQEAWEALVTFGWLRKHGDDPGRKNTIHVLVEIDNYDEDEE